MTTILIYNGKGSATNGPKNLETILKKKYSVKTAVKITKDTLKGIDILVLPGGDSGRAYLQNIDGNTIREFVKNGGHFLGVCAGGFAASHEVFSGSAVYYDHKGSGSTGLKTFDIAQKVRSYAVSFEGQLSVKMKDGGVKTLQHYRGAAMKGGETLATYNDNKTGYKDHAAIVGDTYGKGRVVLCGPHPEHSPQHPEILYSLVDYLLKKTVTTTPVKEVNYDTRKDYQIFKSDWKLMMNAVKEYLKTSSTLNKVFIRQNGVKTANYITYKTKYKELLTRWNAFIASEKREPNYLTIVYNAPTQPVQTSNWTLTGYFKQDFQDTGYTCGPTSLSMVLSALGYSFSEQTLMKLAGTTTDGTGHSGLFTAAKKVAPVKTAEYRLSEIGGWQGVSTKLKEGKEFIVHLWTASLPNWDGAFGHYVFLTGVNIKEKKVRIFDPIKGDITYTTAQLERAMNDISQKQLLQFSK